MLHSIKRVVAIVGVILMLISFIITVGVFSTKYGRLPIFIPQLELAIHDGEVYWAKNHWANPIGSKWGMIRVYRNISGGTLEVYSLLSQPDPFAYIVIPDKNTVKSRHGYIDTDCDGLWEKLDIFFIPSVPTCLEGDYAEE